MIKKKYLANAGLLSFGIGLSYFITGIVIVGIIGFSFATVLWLVAEIFLDREEDKNHRGGRE